MYLKIIANIFLICLVTLFDIAFISQMPYGISRLSLLPILILFIFLLGNIRWAAWWVIVGGFILELFNFGVYGFYFLGLFLSLIVIFILFERVMTNRSLYSVSVVGAAATFSYDLVLFFKSYLENNNNSWLLFLKFEIVTVSYGIAIAFILFYILNLVSRRLRPVFLRQQDFKI